MPDLIKIETARRGQVLRDIYGQLCQVEAIRRDRQGNPYSIDTRRIEDGRPWDQGATWDAFEFNGRQWFLVKQPRRRRARAKLDQPDRRLRGLLQRATEWLATARHACCVGDRLDYIARAVQALETIERALGAVKDPP